LIWFCQFQQAKEDLNEKTSLLVPIPGNCGHLAGIHLLPVNLYQLFQIDWLNRMNQSLHAMLDDSNRVLCICLAEWWQILPILTKGWGDLSGSRLWRAMDGEIAMECGA